MSKRAVGMRDSRFVMGVRLCGSVNVLLRSCAISGLFCYFSVSRASCSLLLVGIGCTSASRSIFGVDG